MKLGLSLAMLVVSGGNAFADETVLWKGWTNFGSCNRVVWYTDDFGIKWPTNQSVGQRIDAKISLARSIEESVANRLSSCAIEGVAAAGMTTLLTSGAGAWPTFKGAFSGCLSRTGLAQFTSDAVSIKLTTKCNW